MVSVVDKLEVTELKVFDVLDVRVQGKLREGVRDSLELLLQRLNVIFIDMSISEDMDELTSFKAADLSKHAGKQSVAGDVEGHSEAHVAGSLVHLAGELSVCTHVELSEHVARRQSHFLQV